MIDISILTPSRGRPTGLQRHMDSFLDNAVVPGRIEVLAYVDDDDPALETYRKMPGVQVGPPQSVSVSWNDLAARATGQYLMMGNDDLVMRSMGWDSMFLEAALPADGIFVAWFSDGINDGRHCAFPIVSREWYQALGSFSPGIFEFFYNDTWVFDVGKMVDRLLYMDDVKMAHIHHSVTRKKDETTVRNRNRGQHGRDTKLYRETVGVREQWAEKLRKVMG